MLRNKNLIMPGYGEILHVDETHYRVLIEEGKFKECDASLADQAQGDYCLIEKGSKAYIVTMVTPDLDSIKLALYSYSRGTYQFSSRAMP